jgi:uncharacterized protein
MARRKAQREKQETALMFHKAPRLIYLLLERAECTGNSARAVKAYLDAGGSAVAVVQGRLADYILHMPLLHCMALTNAHPHRELGESVRLLVEAGADINASFTDSNGVDHISLMRGVQRWCCTGVLDVLHQAGADLCARSSPQCMTALHEAAQNGLAESCEWLLARTDSLLEAKDSTAWTALMHASAYGRLDNVKLLLKRGADVNTANCDGVSALSAACLTNHLHVAVCLLKAGADVNAVDYQGSSALSSAVQSDNMPIVQLLLDHGADINTTDMRGHTVLFKAVDLGHVHMTELLVQRGLSVHAADDSGQTLLMIAVMARQKAAAEWLLQHGVAVNAGRYDSGTALHAACAEGSSDDIAMVALLLASGADVHKCAIDQITALDVAALYGNLQCARVLIAAGADVQHASLVAAIIHKQAKIVRLLLKHGATAVANSVISAWCPHGAQCCDGVTALMLCTEPYTVKLLLAAGADVHVTNAAGSTCLHAAVRHRASVPMMCLLIKAGVDLHAVNNSSKTAAQIAHERGYVLTEQLLSRAAQQGH